MADGFAWISHDARSLLPPGWTDAVLALARRGVSRLFVPNAITSREADRTTPMRICEVPGDVVRGELPWLYAAYHGWVRELAQRTTHEVVSAARCDRYGVILNILCGDEMRYICHVDSNPISGLLYATDHPPGTGGELVVANHRDARSVAEVDHDCQVIHPSVGQLLLFDGRAHTHYVRPLRGSKLRVVVAMNFYTESAPETVRPADLDHGAIVED